MLGIKSGISFCACFCMLCMPVLRMNYVFLQSTSKPHCFGDCCNLSVELLHHPVLRANSSWPTEGEPVTLTCEIQLPPQRSDVRLQFCFFKDGQILGPGWSSSPEFQINTIWREDSGSYWCKAQTVTSRVWKQSRTSQIYVQSECQWVLRFPRTGASRSQTGLHIFLGHWSMWKVLLIPMGKGAVHQLLWTS